MLAFTSSKERYGTDSELLQKKPILWCLDFSFWAPKLWENKFLFFLFLNKIPVYWKMNSIPSHGVCGYMSWLYVLEALQNEHRQVSISFKDKKKKKKLSELSAPIYFKDGSKMTSLYSNCYFKLVSHINDSPVEKSKFQTNIINLMT